MKWKSWGSGHHSGEGRGVFWAPIFLMGPQYFPSLFFFLCSLKWTGLDWRVSRGGPTHVCALFFFFLPGPPLLKIDSDGIWWLTHCLNLGGRIEGVGVKTTWEKEQEDSHTLCNYTQGWAPMHLPWAGQRELRSVCTCARRRGTGTPGIHSLCQVTTSTR